MTGNVHFRFLITHNSKGVKIICLINKNDQLAAEPGPKRTNSLSISPSLDSRLILKGFLVPKTRRFSAPKAEGLAVPKTVTNKSLSLQTLTLDSRLTPKKICLISRQNSKTSYIVNNLSLSQNLNKSLALKSPRLDFRLDSQTKSFLRS